MIKTFLQFHNFLNNAEKNKLKFIFFITSLSFILEFVSISSIPIYFSLVTEQESSLGNFKKLLYFFDQNFEIQSIGIINLGIIIILIFLIKNLILFYLLIYENKFYENVKNRLTDKLYSDFINSDYEKLLSFNPSNISRTTVSSVNDAFLYLQSLLGIYKESLAIFAIFLIILLVNPITVIVIFLLFFMISLTYYEFLRPFLHNAGEKNQIILSKVIKTLNETFGSIKELRILNKENKIKDNFSSDIYVYNKNFFYFSIIQRLPKIILEIFFLATLMLATIYFLNQNQNFLSIVPELALYTLISLRFIPAFNSMSSNFTYLKIGEASIRIIFNDLKKLNEKSNTKRNLFESSKKKLPQLKSYIYLENLSYKYPNKNLISLKDINGGIDKGENVVITGTTGSGKTTLVNLMLGFLKPQSGNIYFTGKSIFEFSNRWIEQVSYVSQSCYLMDRSIIDNITFNFGNEKTDRKKLEMSLQLSNLDEFIKSLPDRENTKVGNDGVKISGGERQRIALARAIYKNSNIIFMDEFSSALDVRTEEFIFKNLIEEFKDKTIITISHRENIIKNCDKKFILNQGTLKIL